MSTIKLSNTTSGMALIASRYPMVYDAFYKTPGLLMSIAAFLGIVCGVFHIGSAIGEAMYGTWDHTTSFIRITAWIVVSVFGNIVLIQGLNLAMITAVRIRLAMWARAHDVSMEYLASEQGMNHLNTILVKQEVTKSLNKAGKSLGKKGISIEAKGDMQIIDKRHESKDSGLSDPARGDK